MGSPPTRTSHPPAPDDRTTSAAPGAVPGEEPAAAGLAPGQVFAGRYRVISALGKGGMGEVFRVQDLKLGQPAALKLLPEQLARVPQLLEQFHHELRLGREVTHPAVCRVFDIGEHEGRHFLTMECVDGEDLASLLRRIGRLPAEKALEIFAAITSAVAAAHAKGVLHRDLKPANVMLDGQGRVRVMDFGLAARDGESLDGEVAGTPSYMAPEQFDGRGVTARSDVYALGLILFELLTGRRPFQASTFAEWAEKHRTALPPSPGSLVPDLDPALEALVLRCLEKKPEARPASALAVAAALPGSDPLSAILASGGTPSPELVASLAETQTVALRTVAALALGFVVLTAATLALGTRTSALRLSPLGRSPEVLADRARELARGAGYSDPPADTALQLYADATARAELNAHGREGFFPVMRIVYREARAPLEAKWFRRFEESVRNNAAGDYRRHRMSWFDVAPGRVTRFDPALDQPGMVTFEMAPDGRVLSFRALPATAAPRPAAPDWRPFFAAAGLEAAQLEPATPVVAATVGADAWSAWTARAGPDVRVTAASLRGIPVLFEVTPLHPPAAMRERISSTVPLLIAAAVLLAGAILVPRNLRLGRADRRGALRLARVVFLLYAAQWALGASHVPTGAEIDSFANGLGRGLTLAAIAWMAYVTVEPFVRRRWPQMLVAWSRLLSGHVNDPAVARDLLLGAVMGGAGVLAFTVIASLGPHLGWPVVYRIPPPDDLLGLRWAVAGRLGAAAAWLVQVMSFPLCLVAARRLLRSELAAGVAVALLISMGTWGASPAFAVGSTLLDAVLVLAVLRFGLLAGVTAAVVSDLLLVASFALPVSGWAAGAWIVPLVILALLVAVALRTTLAGRDVARQLLDS